MDPTRLKALLEAVHAVQDATSRLEREIMDALADDQTQTSPNDLQSSGEEWLTLAELADWLKRGRTTAYKLITSKAVPYYRVGRAIRVRRVDVRRWLDENREEIGG